MRRARRCSAEMQTESRPDALRANLVSSEPPAAPFSESKMSTISAASARSRNKAVRSTVNHFAPVHSAAMRHRAVEQTTTANRRATCPYFNAAGHSGSSGPVLSLVGSAVAGPRAVHDHVRRLRSFHSGKIRKRVKGHTPNTGHT